MLMPITRAQPRLPSRVGKVFSRMERGAQLLRERLNSQPDQDPAHPVRVPASTGKRHVRVAPFPDEVVPMRVFIVPDAPVGTIRAGEITEVSVGRPGHQSEPGWLR